jgi:hypothetical protein
LNAAAWRLPPPSNHAPAPPKSIDHCICAPPPLQAGRWRSNSWWPALTGRPYTPLLWASRHRGGGASSLNRSSPVTSMPCWSTCATSLPATEQQQDEEQQQQRQQEQEQCVGRGQVARISCCTCSRNGDGRKCEPWLQQQQMWKHVLSTPFSSCQSAICERDQTAAGGAVSAGEHPRRPT